VQEWIDATKRNIQAISGGAKQGLGQIVGGGGGAGGAGATGMAGAGKPADFGGAAKLDASSPRAKIAAAKNTIPFLQEEDSKVLEFWQIWSESIPPKEELQSGQSMDFIVAASADMEKLTWRVAGPQNIFIQKMVDFFWNVGAPETEIDRLNDVGALINPIKIGSWIDMSSKGGMDGGWFFPVDINAKLAIEAADAGEPTRKVMEWADNHGVSGCFAVGRDMGAAPPRQTEMRMRLPGQDFGSQFAVAQDAFLAFGFPAIPEVPANLLRQHVPEYLSMSVITSCEGFVRLGLLIPKPSRDLVNALIDFAGGKRDAITRFEAILGSTGPQFVELQFLMKGFGYGVYKEGFDVVFHWQVGEEWGQS
jgi:hypothetical protein